MANNSTNRGHRPKKQGARRVNVNLKNIGVVDDLPLNTTDTIDTALMMMSIVKNAALEGKPEAIALLARLGLDVSWESIEPTIVLRPDGEVAAWIV
jgi:hypothetical protein